MRRSNTATWTIAAILTLCVAHPAAAANASRQENVGVGTGALIGVAAGGPVGLIIGAAIGAKIGDSFNRNAEHVGELQGSLQNSRNTAANLEAELRDASARLTDLQQVARPQLVSLMQAGIDMDLLFRTDEFALTDTTGDRLAQLAGTLAQMPEVFIQLDGFSDERGDAGYNYSLSEKRVNFVRDQFISAGVEPQRISSSAHGESVAQDQNIDSFAMERRVSVRLFIDGTESMASNPL